MATVVFQTIGSYWGPWGAAIGAAIGGVIDNQLFGPDDQEGPRLDDLSVMTSTYGAPIPIMYGPTNRVTGNVIWATDLRERKKTSGGGKGGGPETTEYSYSVSLAVAISRRQIKSVQRIWANKKIIFDATQDTTGTEYSLNGRGLFSKIIGSVVANVMAEMPEIRIYQGTSTQEPDSIIEAEEGVGNVPAYRNTAYVVIKDLQLGNFGNRIPNLEFEVEADTEITVGAVSKDLIDRSGIQNASVFGLTDTVRGYTIASQMPVYRAMTALEVGYNFVVSEQRGQIRCVKKALGMKGSIPLEAMNARLPDDMGDKQPIEYSDTTEVGMPDQVTVTFKDVNSEYQRNSQAAFRRRGNAVNKVTQDIPLVLTPNEAKKIADRLLWGAWSNKRSATFKYSDEFVRLNPADVVGIPFVDESLPFAITRVTRGNNGISEVEGVYDDPEVFASNATGIASIIQRESVSVPGVTVFVPMDAPLLRDENNDDGFYWAVTSASSAWRGASILRSTDGGTTYASMSDVGVRTPIGTVSGVLADGPTVVFDRSNTITVTLESDTSELESISELLVLNGGNAAWVGPAEGGVGEIIQFANATLVGANTYQLDTFLRGRKGTEHYTGSHVSGERFVLLDQDTLGTNSFSIADWDLERSYKPVSVLLDESITDAQAFTNTGVRAKPLSPVHVLGSRDGSNNLTITWLRRSRKTQLGLGNGNPPLGETSESYEIDVYDGATVVRTITATSETATYTASQQSSDGLTPGNSVTIDVYQISSTRGRGYPARAII